MKHAAKYDKGDIFSIEELYYTHFDELCFYSYSYVPDIEVSKDIVQEAFVSLLVARDQYIPTRALLYTFVKNRAIDYLRKQNRSKSVSNADLPIDTLDQYVNELIVNQEDYLAIEDISKEIFRSIEGLPPQCRRVFEMSRARHMNNREIAIELNISIKGVEKQITKALSAISVRLSRER